MVGGKFYIPYRLQLDLNAKKYPKLQRLLAKVVFTDRQTDRHRTHNKDTCSNQRYRGSLAGKGAAHVKQKAG